MYSPTRFSALKLDATPSFQFSNLTSNADVIAYSHGQTVHVLPTSALADVGKRSATFKLQLGAAAASDSCAVPGAAAAAATAAVAAAAAAASGQPAPQPEFVVSGDSVTQVAAVSLEAGRLLVATTPTSFHVFSCSDFGSAQATAPRPLFTRHLVDCGAAVLGQRSAGSHFFRGIGGCHQHNCLLVGTSFGDILAWRVEGTVLTLVQTLTGGHSSAITSIHCDDRFIVSGDDAGIVCQWTVSGAPSRAPSTLLARHDKGEGAPVTGLGIVGASPAAAAAAAYADGRVRVFLLGGAPLPGSGGSGVPSSAAAAAQGRALELELGAHVGAATALCVHPRLPTFATAGQDGVVCVWSLPELAGRGGGGKGGASSSGSSSGSSSSSSSSSSTAAVVEGGERRGSVGRLVLDMSTKVSTVAMLTGLAFTQSAGSSGLYHLLVSAYELGSLRIFLGL